MPLAQQEALEDDPMSRAQTAKQQSSSSSSIVKVFYIRLGEDRTGYHKAIYVKDHDLGHLIEQVRLKFACSQGRSLRLVHIDNHSQQVPVSESILSQLPDGQDLFIEYLSERCFAPNVIGHGQPSVKLQSSAMSLPPLDSFMPEATSNPINNPDWERAPWFQNYTSAPSSGGSSLAFPHNATTYMQQYAAPHQLQGETTTSLALEHEYMTKDVYMNGSTFDPRTSHYSDMSTRFAKNGYDQYPIQHPASSDVYNTHLSQYLAAPQHNHPNNQHSLHETSNTPTTSSLSLSPRPSLTSSATSSQPRTTKAPHPQQLPRKIKTKDERLADNRLAAAKSRANKKEKQSTLQNIAHDLKIENRKLCAEVDELQGEVEGLRGLLERHEDCVD